jgi:hypothetical protein
MHEAIEFDVVDLQGNLHRAQYGSGTASSIGRVNLRQAVLDLLREDALKGDVGAHVWFKACAPESVPAVTKG